MFAILAIENFFFFNTEWYSIEMYLAFAFFFVNEYFFVLCRLLLLKKSEELLHVQFIQIMQCDKSLVQDRYHLAVSVQLIRLSLRDPDTVKPTELRSAQEPHYVMCITFML